MARDEKAAPLDIVSRSRILRNQAANEQQKSLLLSELARLKDHVHRSSELCRQSDELLRKSRILREKLRRPRRAS